MSGRGRPVRKTKARRLYSPNQSELSNPISPLTQIQINKQKSDNNPTTSKKANKFHRLSDSPFSTPLAQPHSQIDQTIARSPSSNSIPDHTPFPEVVEGRLVNLPLIHDTTAVKTSKDLGLDPVFHFEENPHAKQREI